MSCATRYSMSAKDVKQLIVNGTTITVAPLSKFKDQATISKKESV